MCGISGVITTNSIAEYNLISTLNLMKKRGPDFQNYTTGKFGNKNFALLHSRLAIIDLQSTSNQPFLDKDYHLIFNGEIYNYIELREKLKKKNHHFKTKSDTEVIIKAFQEYGEDCVNYFNGMWAFVIWNKKKRTFFFSRDRFGEKPLYYFKDKNNFVFGSEIKFIKNILDKKIEINKKKIFNFLNFGYKSLHNDNETFYKNIFSVNSGENLIVDQNFKIKKKKYWLPKFKINNDISYKDIVNETDKILTNSLNIRMRSDVPLAFCLSGGVDSGYLASLARKKFSKKISTFSIIDKDPRYNELENINKIVNDLECYNEQILLSKKENFLKKMKELIVQHDSPISTLSYYIHSFLSEQISKKGFKVAISGTGADEIFTGYYEHFHLFFASLDQDNINFTDELESWKKNVLPFIRNEKLKKSDLYIKNPKDASTSFNLPNNLKKIMRNEKKNMFINSDYIPIKDPLKNKLLNELFQEVVPVILRHDDLNSMNYSIENRSPYLDHNLFEFLFQVPSKHLIKNSYQKRILRDISKDILVDEVRTFRQKFGFNANLNSLVSRDDLINYFLEDIDILEEYIDKDKLIKFLKEEENLFEGEKNKFIFSLLSCKIFLELNS